MSLKNAKSKSAKTIGRKKKVKEFYDVKLSAQSIFAINTLINLGLSKGDAVVNDGNGKPVCVLADLVVDLKREFHPQIK